MENATYKDGILIVEGKRYCVVDRINGEKGRCFMIIQDEGNLFRKSPLTAEWAFPETLESIDDYDWEDTAFLKRIG